MHQLQPNKSKQEHIQDAQTNLPNQNSSQHHLLIQQSPRAASSSSELAIEHKWLR
jgi:hypothetical protein